MAVSRRRFLKTGTVGAGWALGAWRSIEMLRADSADFGPAAETAAKQIGIPRVEQMPNIPQPFMMRDWRQVAKDFDAHVFDLDAKGPFLPLVWIDQSHINYDEDTFELYVTVDDPRCGPRENNGEYHDAICDLPAVIGATLVGIDKSKQSGRNWVSMCKAFFNRANGRNVVMQNTRDFNAWKVGGGYGIDFWQDVFPSLLFYQLTYYYPQEPHFEEILKSCAAQFYRATEILKNSPRGFGYSTFDFKTMKPVVNKICSKAGQPDAAAGFAWLEYMAYLRYRDPKYLQAAKWAMDALNAEKENPIYNTILPFGAYVSARMNAEQGSHSDTARMVNWCFGGGHMCIGGVSAGRWGDYDVSGLVTMYDDRPYLFETFQLGSSLVPLVRYDPRLARAVGKWMLNAANNARLFYPGELPDEYQATPQLKAVSKNVISYEVLLGRDSKHLLPSEEPQFKERLKVPFIASRDPWEAYSPLTGKQYVFPEVSHFSLYSCAPAGIFGGIISRTDDEKILQLDCLKTDYFHEPAYPTYLYFNPYDENKEIHIEVGTRRVDLYDAVGKRWVKKAVQGRVGLRLGRDSAAVIVQVPATARTVLQGAKLLADGVVVDYYASAT